MMTATPESLAPEPKAAWRVSVVDDEEGIRRSVQWMLESTRSLRLESQYCCAREALIGFAQSPPDAVLMDIRMPDLSGIECTLLVRQRHPWLRVIMISGLSDEDTVKLAFQAGCDAFLVKPFTPLQCLTTLRGVLLRADPAQGPACASSEAPGCDVCQAHGCPRVASSREQSILEDLARGRLYKEIAQHLQISLPVVTKTIHLILEEFQAANRVEAVNRWRLCQRCPERQRREG